MLKVNFSYTDEFGQESTLVKTFEYSALEFQNSFDLLIDNFKSFLLAAGYEPELVDKIEIKY